MHLYSITIHEPRPESYIITNNLIRSFLSDHCLFYRLSQLTSLLLARNYPIVLTPQPFFVLISTVIMVDQTLPYLYSTNIFRASDMLLLACL